MFLWTDIVLSGKRDEFDNQKTFSKKSSDCHVTYWWMDTSLIWERWSRKRRKSEFEEVLESSLISHVFHKRIRLPIPLSPLIITHWDRLPLLVPQIFGSAIMKITTLQKVFSNYQKNLAEKNQAKLEGFF